MGFEEKLTESEIAPILSMPTEVLEIIIGYATPRNSLIPSNTRLVCTQFKKITDSFNLAQCNHKKAPQSRFEIDQPNLELIKRQQQEIDFLLKNEAAILCFNFPEVKGCFAKLKASVSINSPSHRFIVCEKILDQVAMSIIKTKISATPKDYAKRLNCNHSFLTRFPGKVITENPTYWACLEQLDLDSNQLQSLPPEIGQLSKLESLAVTNNQLQKLPVEIGQFKSLLFLFAKKNQLKSLPVEIVLGRIYQLHLQNNQLESLPPEIVHLAQRTQLYLAKNQFTEFPESLRETALRDEQDNVTTKAKVLASQNVPQVLPNEVKRLKIG